MATLEKIRKKSVLLIVIIGAALLAFILGDAITNGRTLFGNGTTVAKLGDTKVDISEYQQRMEMLQNANPNADGQEMSQFAINSLIEEKLYNEAAEELGIEVSDEMVTFFIMDNPLYPYEIFAKANMQYIAQIYPKLTQENAQNPRFIYSLIFTPEKYGLSQDAVEPLKQNWLVMEKETKDAARVLIYQRLLAGMIQPNALDKKDLFANEYESTTIDFVAKRFTDLSKYKVSDDELKAEYEKCKNLFKVNEDTKTVAFLAYHVTPSDADKQNAKKLQTAALTALQNGTKLGKDLIKAGVQSQTMKTSASAIPDPQIANFVRTDSVGKVGQFENNGSFTLVKVLNKLGMANEGAELVAIQVLKDSEQALKDAIAGGLSIDSVATRFAADQVMVSPAQNVALQNPQERRQLPETLATQLDTLATPGALLEIQSAPEGAVLAYVKSLKPQVPVYEIETMTYSLYPSKETIEAASDAMAKYAASNNTPAKFADNAKKAGYSYQVVPVTGSTVGFRTDPVDAQLGNYYPMASKLVSWAVTDGEPGNVSSVVSNDNSQNPYIYIAMVENEYEDFAPYNDSAVKKVLEARVQANKAGDDLIKQYSGKGDINATAQAMGEALFTDEIVRFNKSPKISDAKVLARIAGSKVDNKVVLVKGDDGVYAYVVKSKNPATVTMNPNEVNKTYIGVFGDNKNLSNMLRGNKRMENNLYKMTGTR